MIQVPVSVAFYWGDAVNRAAINVLAGSTEVPTDLTLAEVERFELASLAARRVRVEYWTMLRALRSATWEVAVRAHFPGAKLLSYGGHRSFVDEVGPVAEPSVDYVWAQLAVCGVFDLPGRGRLFTRVAFVEGERGGELQFYVWDLSQSAEISNNLDLGSDWGQSGPPLTSNCDPRLSDIPEQSNAFPPA